MTVTSEPWKRRQYTPDERARILVAVKQVGVAEAARRHGVPQTTVSNWLGRDAAKVFGGHLRLIRSRPAESSTSAATKRTAAAG